MNNKTKLFLTKYAAQINPMDPALSAGLQVDRGPQQKLGPVGNFNAGKPQQFMGANGKPIEFDEDPDPNTISMDPKTFNMLSEGAQPVSQPQMADSKPILPGTPVTPGSNPSSGKPTTPLNGLPGYALGASRPSQQYDASGVPEGFPGYSPNPSSDPFQKKPPIAGAGAAQGSPLPPPPGGGIQGLGSMSGRTLPIPR